MMQTFRYLLVLVLLSTLQAACTVVVPQRVAEPLRQVVPDAMVSNGESCLALNVTDEIGVSVDSAMVMLTDFAGGTRLTNETGFVYLSPITGGDHTVTVIKPGYRAYSQVHHVPANSWKCDTPVVLENLSRRSTRVASTE